MTDIPKPGPHVFQNKRINAVPPSTRPPRAGRQPHGFDDSMPRRGDPALTGYVDAGMFMALGSGIDHNARLGVLEHYDGRLTTGTDAKAEVVHWARKDVRGRPRDECTKIAAAKTAQTSMLTGDQIPICQGAETRLVNAILAQLEDYADGQDWRSHREDDSDPAGVRSLEKHAGEAVLIAHAIAAPRSSLLLTNDTGASAIAKDRSISAWHYGHVLHELVCNNCRDLTAQAAATLFTQSVDVAALRADVQAQIETPNVVQWMTCRRQSDGSCAECSARI